MGRLPVLGGMWMRCLLPLVLLHGAVAIEMEWTSYSDRADLPMSTAWREQMKAKMQKIDTDALSPAERAKYKALWKRLEGEPSSERGGRLGIPPVVLIIAGCCLIVGYWHFVIKDGGSFVNSATKGNVLGSLGKPGQPQTTCDSSAAMRRDLQAARLRRFDAQASATTISGNAG
mmetsp:Transcript_10889/g.24740  ORF Transcript_10889/g.24740 Transcript_10889/m.24740 type:complete len:174 (+) Transcript_10889:52-573(+)